MEKEMKLLLVCALMMVYAKRSFAKVQCKYPEVHVRLGPKENHTVPICSVTASDWTNGRKSESLKRDVFTCDALVCNRCRCDVKMGYKLSNDTKQAECVLFCPRIRFSKITRPNMF